MRKRLCRIETERHQKRQHRFGEIGFDLRTANTAGAGLQEPTGAVPSRLSITNRRVEPNTFVPYSRIRSKFPGMRFYQWRQHVSDELIAAQFMEHEKKKKKKKKDKVRSAWISFAGRIVAQIVGAAATVTLGVLVLHKYSGPEGRQTPKAHANYVEQSAEVGPMRAAGENSVAVLPMENFSADPEHDHFADAMTEVLIASLSKTHGLRVISRTSSMQFKGDRKPLRQIAQQLGARWIVEGSVAWADTRVRITAQLIE